MQLVSCQNNSKNKGIVFEDSGSRFHSGTATYTMGAARTTAWINSECKCTASEVDTRKRGPKMQHRNSNSSIATGHPRQPPVSLGHNTLCRAPRDVPIRKGLGAWWVQPSAKGENPPTRQPQTRRTKPTSFISSPTYTPGLEHGQPGQAHDTKPSSHTSQYVACLWRC